MYILSKNDALTPELILELTESFLMNEQPRLMKLKRYYKAQNEITNKVKADENRPNYRIAHAFASYISDTMTGYFMGTPVSYQSEDDSRMETISQIFDYNDEQSHNLRLARDASIYGVAYELMYLSKGTPRFKDIDPRKAFPVYDDTLEQELLYFIRVYGTDSMSNDKYYVEVFTDKERLKYEMHGFGTKGTLTFLESARHGFGLVPVSIYCNNRDRMGDFEKVIPMIDAYDSITSNTLNDLENFADAYLIFQDVDLDDEDLISMREHRLIQYTGEGKISWLTKDVLEGGAYNGAQAKIEEQIFALTGCPNLSDKNFAGNSSGVAIKYKLQPLELKTGIKEREFKVGLQRRLELLGNIVQVLDGDFSYLNVEMNFNRTLPVDLLYEAQFANTIKGIVSEETMLSQLTFVSDPKDEMEAIESQGLDALDFNFDTHSEVDTDGSSKQ